MTADITLVLRTCAADLTSHGGFQWPVSGHVTAPDWDPAPNCGAGLHGLAWGEGDGHLLDWSDNARWLVVSVPTDTLVDLAGKVKFPAGEVVHCGDRQSATAYLATHGGHGRAIAGLTSTSGNGGTSTSGHRGTSTSGHRGTSTSGYWGTSTSGDWGTSTSGDGGTSTSGHGGTSTSGHGGTSTSGYWGTSTSGHGGTSTSGDGGTSTSGDGGTSTSGDYGTSTSGDYGTSTSGDYGTSTSGNGGTSTSGDYGTSTSGNGGTSTSGEGGVILIRWHDGKRYRIAVGYVGEDGLKPDTPYQVDGTGRFVEVTP